MQPMLVVLFLHLWVNVVVCLEDVDVCAELPNVPNAVLSEERKSGYQLGDQIYFSCNFGYVSGPTITHECTTRGWNLFRGNQCRLKQCELPDDIANGEYEFVSGDDFVFGATIQYKCNTGFLKVGMVDSSTCMINGWSNRPPKCEPVSCTWPTEEGDIIIRDLPSSDRPILRYHILTFSCQGPGKKLKGSSTLECGSDGEWSAPFPTCEDITCEVEPLGENLDVKGLPTTAGQTMKFDHALQFKCLNEYVLSGEKEVRCNSLGRWTAPFPKCIDGCKVPSLATNVMANIPATAEKVAKGGKLTFSCRSSQYLHGNRELECLETGQWNGEFPTCDAHPRDCEAPPTIEDGDFTTQPRYRHEDTPKYTCQLSYTIEGKYTCDNGIWAGEVKCLKPCTVESWQIAQHNLRFLKEATKYYCPHKDHLTFACLSGFTQGNQVMRRMCTNGVMDFPTCTQPTD